MSSFSSVSLSNSEPFKNWNRAAGATLESVDMSGRAEGLKLSLSIRQRYVNRSENNCEFVYTFPLPYGAVLLEMNAEIDGRKLAGMVVAREQAEKDYEKAIDEGDAPILVNESASGLFTANVGNVKTGEAVTVETRYAQLLRFEQGRLSLRIPTVVAQRYGAAHGPGGLAAHETAAPNAKADYPLSLRLEVVGELAQARLSSPSHQLRLRAETGRLWLEVEGAMDRDVVVNFDDLPGRAFALSGVDGENHVVLASFCPRLEEPETPSASLRLKILVDCSGSMAGDGIAGAREALRWLVGQLKPQDEISYSRFGNEVRHDLPRLTPCGPETLAALETLIGKTEADLGGTELRRALLSIFDMGGGEGAALLLITDGAVWDMRETLQAARNSGHRLFVFGMGSAANETLLRQLVEETGGGCELLAPREDLKAAVQRQFNRLRTTRQAQVEINWGAEPLWRSACPGTLYDGETVHVFAAFDKPLDQPPRLTWRSEGQEKSDRAASLSPSDDPDLRRLGGHRRMSGLESGEALELALRYQLVGSQSSLFLVHVREDGDKAQGLPELRQIAQMHAAGHMGLGGIGVRCVSSPLRSLGRRLCRSEGSYSLPTWLHRRNFEPGPDDLLNRFRRLAAASGDFQTAAAGLDKELVAADKAGRILEILTKDEGLNRPVAWAVLLNWLAARFKGGWGRGEGRAARKMLRETLAGLPEERRQALSARLDALLPGLTAASWGEMAGI